MVNKVENISLSSLSFCQNPYETYSELKKKGNIHYIENNNTFLIIGYNEIKDILINTEIFSSEGENSFDSFLLNCDPPKHTLHRQILKGVNGLFSQERIRNLYHQNDLICKRLINSLNKDSFDLINHFAQPYSTAVILNLLEIENVSEIITDWTYKSVSNSTIHHQLKAHNAWHKVEPLVLKLVEETLKKSNKTGLSEILNHKQAPDYFNIETMVHLTKVLLVGGNETTPNLIGSVWYFLQKNREYIEIAKNSKENLVQIINEILRLEAPTQIIHRISKKDTIVNGVHIPANSLISLAIGAGNRDAGYFENPNEFILDRKNKKNLSFGYGAHHCIGAALSKQETEIAVSNLLEQFSDTYLLKDFSPIYRNSSHVRGLVYLPVLNNKSSNNIINEIRQKAFNVIKDDISQYGHFSSKEFYPNFEPKKDKGWHYTYPSPFIHSNVMYSLVQSGQKDLAEMGIAFLKNVAIQELLWSFWDVYNCQHPVPPDVDDTAIVSLVLSKLDYEINNKDLLLNNIDNNGNIGTWIKNSYKLLWKHPKLFFQLMKNEKKVSETQELGMFNWEDNEVGVAANVLMYLGEGNETEKAIKKCIDNWRNNKTGQYYDKKIIEAYHLARAYNEGIKSFEIIKNEIKEYVEQEIDSFEFAELLLSALILSYFDEGESILGINIRKRIINAIISEDLENLFYHYPYFTSKDRIFFAGSSSLTAAWFLEVVSYWNLEKNT